MELYNFLIILYNFFGHNYKLYNFLIILYNFLVILTNHRNFAPHSRNQNSCLRCNFILQAFLGSRLEASSPRDSPSKLGSPLGSSLLGSRLEASSPRDSSSKLGSPLGSSLLDILEQSTTIATGLLCILHKPFNVVKRTRHKYRNIAVGDGG